MAVYDSGVATGYYPRTANMDWCENNYVFTPYVAEVFNVLSSIPIALFALHGMLHCLRHKFERRHALAHFSFLAVGVGSCFFHGTLTWQGQAADELSMIWGASVFLYMAVHVRAAEDSPAFMAALLVYDIFSTVLYFSGYYIVFFLLYSVLAGPTMWLALAHSFRNGPQDRKVISRRTRVMGITSVVLYLGGFLVFWLPENQTCGNRLHTDHATVFQQLQFHALFHTTSALGTYLWCVFILHARVEWLRAHDPAWFEACHGFSIAAAIKNRSKRPLSKQPQSTKGESKSRNGEASPSSAVDITVECSAHLLTLGLPLPSAVIVAIDV